MLKDNLFLASLAVLILLVLAVLGLVLYLAVRRSTGKGAAADPKMARLRFDSLRNSFRQAVELIEANIASRSERYSIPWVLVLNEGGSRAQLPIEQSGVASALSTEAAMAASAQGIAWHFFDRGVVVDIQGAYLGSPDDEDAAEKPWDEFLGLCRKYRPQRPFDSVVITVPAALLMDDRPDARLELGKLAKLAHRRLWLAQNRFAMRFAVYVVVSGCEQVEGFAQFARQVPESVRASMLGWSSPFDLSTTYQSTWVDDAMDAVVKTTTDTSAELFAMSSGTQDAGKFFLLPSRLDAMRAQLQVYVDELMRPSAYHEPFFFRGIYLTGDSSESAQKAMGSDPLALPAPDASEMPALDTQEVMLQLMREPAFLRDLFEKKIFSEYGLARPSKQQLARPALSRFARWTAVTVVVVWSVGLVVATVQLDTRHGELARTLAQIQSDADFRSRAAERNETLPADWYRRKALALLAANEKLGADSPWTFFMPGSWKAFDDLEERAADRIEREFGEIAINTLRRELYARASELTGVAQDGATGELIIGGECNAPVVSAGFEGARKLTLSPEELPEFSAMLQYLASVEQLDAATQAMLRLQKPSTTESSDLRLLVKYTLGAELPGNISRSLKYFHAAPASGIAGSPAAISVGPLQQAARCTFTKGMNGLDTRLFVANDLLLTEQKLSSQGARLFAPDAAPLPFGATVDGYRDVLASLKDEENLLGPGKGAWMRQPTLNLGPAYDRVLARVAQARLLGPEVAEQSRQRSYFAFQKFNTEFVSRLGSDGSTGITWIEKEARFGLSPERLALRDALTALLNQPFMTAPNGRPLPELPSQSNVAWDAQKLDQALALAEVRKRFLEEGLVKFPPAARQRVQTFVDMQLANLVNDYAVQAVSTSARQDLGVGDAAAFDAARTRLARVQALLADLGSRDRADQLRSVVSHDAMNRLRLVDENLQRSELYSVRGRDFRWWQGDKSPLFQAFGVQDGAGLLQYLAQQFNRAETLGRQADAYIASLDFASATGSTALRWQAINRDLERYRLKNPNSSLALLEQFLVTLGPDLDRSTCTDKLAGKSPGARPADYFAERHNQIYSALLARCNELHTREQQDQWAYFSGAFNKLLAGRQPFSQSVSRDQPVADFEDVGQMLKTYEKAAKAIKEQGDSGKGGVQAASARRFVDQFERVKAFLAPLYPTEDGAAAGYDVLAEFRVNQPSEFEGNKVIDWTLEIGGQVLRFREPAKVLRWEPGSPVTLTLRLAKDSQATPLLDPQQGAMHVEGKNVVWRFADPWALLSMIQRQREPETTLRGDSRTQLLRLEFPIAMATEDPKAPPVETRSRVYLRLTLSPAGKKTPLAWPGLFPVRAPEWAGS